MPNASYAVPHFLGGEISQFAQGRFDKPDYRMSLNVCFNAFPVEIGAWVRRPGTRHAGPTRGGTQGRTVKFDFEQSNALTAEFTDGWLRFRSGINLATTNDSATVLAVSTASPAVVQLSAAATWLTGDTVIFPAPGPSALLENRQFIATKIDATHFSIVDALTSVAIDGTTLGTIAAGSAITRVQEITTPYIGGSWADIRLVQAETTAILLNGTIKPYSLTVTTLPTTTAGAVFALAPAVFNDGPYLDPFTNGVQATPSAKSGIVSITLSFLTYGSTTAYPKGAFITSSGINYISLLDQNVGNTPASSPTWWQATSAAAAVNDGRGFLGSDIGRAVRLLSEPPAWSVSASYGGAGVYVSYNPTNKPGAATYWVSLAANTGVIPGTDTSKWQLAASGTAQWTWGRITSLSNLIPRNLSGSVNIGNETAVGGLAAAFDGVFVKNASACAQGQLTGGYQPAGTLITLDTYVGKNYSGASAQKVQQMTIYPSVDNGIGAGDYAIFPSGVHVQFATTVTVLLRASHTAPAFPGNGVVLGTTGPIGNTGSAITIVSDDPVTSWEYVWAQVVVQVIPPTNIASFFLGAAVAQLSLSNPPGTGTGDGFNVEILGAPLLYTNPITTWRLGVYSDTTGWPTCGCYYEGRIWLAGAVSNRFDASVSNGIVGGTIDFSPTDQSGVVAASNAISEVLNSDSVNPIYWMEQDLQGIILGTQAGEYMVQAPTTGPMAPTNIAARRVTKIGCANVDPRRTEHTIVFVQRYGQKLMEYFADVYSGKFSAPNIADKAQHITHPGIAELAYQQAVTPIIWGRGTDGSLFGCTYKRDALASAQGPTYNAWHPHALGSGRVVESICGGPSIGGDLDSLTMVTNDPATGVRHVEIMTDVSDELAPLTAAWFVDNSVAPTSTVSSSAAIDGAPYGGLTLHGLWHLNGKTVSVFAGGLDCGDFAVANGACFVPYGDGVSAGTGGGMFTAAYVASIAPFPIAVGFTYTSKGQLVRPIVQTDAGSRNGPGFGKLTRAHRYAVKLVNTLGMTIGADFTKKLYPVKFQKQNGQPLDPLTTFSGIAQDTLQDDYGYDAALCWQITRPYPANVIAIGPNLSTQDQ